MRNTLAVKATSLLVGAGILVLFTLACVGCSTKAVETQATQTPYVLLVFVTQPAVETPVSPLAGMPVYSATVVPEITGPIAHPISRVFTTSVLYWEREIIKWANYKELDANLVATLMQITSCGNQLLQTDDGYQGIFGVPYYFFPALRGNAPYDPDVNATHGLSMFWYFWNETGFSVQATFAKYRPNDAAFALLGDAIYRDASNNAASSTTLANWLDAESAPLCLEAKQRLGMR